MSDAWACVRTLDSVHFVKLVADLGDFGDGHRAERPILLLEDDGLATVDDVLDHALAFLAVVHDARNRLAASEAEHGHLSGVSVRRCCVRLM